MPSSAVNSSSVSVAILSGSYCGRLLLSSWTFPHEVVQLGFVLGETDEYARFAAGILLNGALDWSLEVGHCRHDDRH